MISSNAGGLPELVVHGEVGFTAPVGDVTSMARHALTLLKDDETWARFSTNARERAATFAPDLIVNQYESYYREVVGAFSAVG